MSNQKTYRTKPINLINVQLYYKPIQEITLKNKINKCTDHI